MKKNETSESVHKNTLCISAHAKNLWMVGISVIVMTIIFCFAIFSNNPKSPPAQDPVEPIVVMGTTGAQQVAFTNPNCMTCPSFNQCFPQGTAGAQQVALTNPNCMTCPSFNQCFPQGTTGAQQAAFSQRYGIVSCPFCNFVYNDADAGIRGASRCPRCFKTFSPQSLNGGGLTNVALTQPIVAPAIFRDAVMPHEYRGVCENCHQIKPDIAIPTTAKMPHKYRGVCSNCHTILGVKAGA